MLFARCEKEYLSVQSSNVSLSVLPCFPPTPLVRAESGKDKKDSRLTKEVQV